MKRTIIVGDIHSCASELLELLKEVSFDKEQDFLLFIGDMIGKGPLPKETFIIYKQTGAICLMGNGEDAFLKNYQNPLFLKEYIEPTKKAMGNYYDDFIQEAYSFPHYLEQKDFLAVHAGLLPNKKPSQMSLADLTKIRRVPHPEKENVLEPWYNFYQEKKLVVFGHWAALQGIVRENIIGIDTGCVYGKKLTALILPERRLVSVTAKKVYLPIA